LREQFIVVLPEDRALQCDGFEMLAMQMVCEFTCELVEAVEVSVEVIVAVLLVDESAVAKPLEDSVDVLW